MKRRTRKADERFYRPNVACELKNRYKSEEAARDAAEFHMLENMTIELDVYRCDVCGYWHMTSARKTR